MHSRRRDNLGRSEAGRNLERRLASLRSEPSQTLIQEDSQWCDRVEVAPLVHCQVLDCEAQVGLKAMEGHVGFPHQMCDPQRSTENQGSQNVKENLGLAPAHGFPSFFSLLRLRRLRVPSQRRR